MPADQTLPQGTDEQLVAAVAGLVRVYEAQGQTDACVRLTPAQARRLLHLAAEGMAVADGAHARH